MENIWQAICIWFEGWRFRKETKKSELIYIPSESYSKVRIYGIVSRISEIQSPVMDEGFPWTSLQWNEMLYACLKTILWKSKSSHGRCSIRKCVLKNFAKSIGKYLCQSLFFNNVAGLRPATLSKKKTLAQVFSCKFCKFLRTHFLQNTSGRLLLKI